MTELDPAAVMADHEGHDNICWNGWNGKPPLLDADRCEPYRLAKALAAEQERSQWLDVWLLNAQIALAAEQAKVARVRIEAERLETRFPSADQVGHEVARWFRTALADEPEQAS